MAEMDHRIGELLDHVAKLGIRDDTIFIIASDNGPEFREPYRGTAGPWSGTYHTAMEGSLRVRCIVRWPGKIPEGVTSNRIDHVTDLFTTILYEVKSPRIRFLFYLKEELRAVKGKDWKLHMVWEPKFNQSSGRLESPYLFNIIRDPKEETDILACNTWVMQPIDPIQEQDGCPKHRQGAESNLDQGWI